MRDLFDDASEFVSNRAVCRVTRHAIGRLTPTQRWAVEEFHLRCRPAEDLAAERGVSRSTIYNTTEAARRNLRRDDEFFLALYGLGAVRDRARVEALAIRYPDGRLPDGRRLVVICDSDA